MVEQDLFNYLKENLYPDLVMSLSPISRWDCYSKKRQHRIELKCRKNHYEELVIEKGKFDAMIRKANENRANAKNKLDEQFKGFIDENNKS